MYGSRARSINEHICDRKKKLLAPTHYAFDLVVLLYHYIPTYAMLCIPPVFPLRKIEYSHYQKPTIRMKTNTNRCVTCTIRKWIDCITFKKKIGFGNSVWMKYMVQYIGKYVDFSNVITVNSYFVNLIM